MGAQTYTANVVAREVSAAMRKRDPKSHGIDAKRVRSWVRANVARFDDDGYTSHQYTSAERTRIVAALLARSKPDATGTAGRASSAARGRAGGATTARKSRKAPPVKAVKVTTPATPETVA